MLGKRCNGTGSGVLADLRTVDLGLLFGIDKDAGREQRCVGVG